MPILVVCNSCATKMHAPDDAASKMVKCPKCAHVVLVPAPTTTAVQPVPPKMPPRGGQNNFLSALP
jgi:hypothetical protein